MATQVVTNVCVVCKKGFEEGEQAYYLAPCTLVSWGRGGYDGTPGIGPGVKEGQLRVRFLGGIRKDRHALCVGCYLARIGGVTT